MHVRAIIEPAIYCEKRFSCACQAVMISLKTPSRDRIFRRFGVFWRIRCKNRQRKIVTKFVIRCVCHMEGLKSWQIMNKMTHKNLKIVKKLVHVPDISIRDVLTTKTCFKHRGTAFDDVKRFLWQRSSEIIW